MGMREKLIELLICADDYCNDNCNKGCNVCKYNGNVDCSYNVQADYLIANGVVIPVRCMDCKHYTTGMAIGMCKRIPDKPIIPMPFNSFCLFGERKNNG